MASLTGPARGEPGATALIARTASKQKQQLPLTALDRTSLTKLVRAGFPRICVIRAVLPSRNHGLQRCKLSRSGLKRREQERCRSTWSAGFRLPDLYSVLHGVGPHRFQLGPQNKSRAFCAPSCRTGLQVHWTRLASERRLFLAHRGSVCSTRRLGQRVRTQMANILVRKTMVASIFDRKLWRLTHNRMKRISWLTPDVQVASFWHGLVGAPRP
jgi:hypothetical protein